MLMHSKCEKPTYALCIQVRHCSAPGFHIYSMLGCSDEHTSRPGTFCFFFWLWVVPALCSTICDAMLSCCGAGIRPGAWGRSSKNTQDLISLWMSLTYNSRRENQKNVDIWCRHAVLHAWIAYQNFPGGDSRSKTSKKA